MKKERIETITDSFVNEYGEKRYFVIAAISELLDEDSIADVANIDRDYYYQDVVKGLKIGFAICNPIDEFDQELGIKIAIGRARKSSEYALLVSKLGYINTTLVQAFLKQEAEYFKSNPENYIAGYKRYGQR